NLDCAEGIHGFDTFAACFALLDRPDIAAAQTQYVQSAATIQTTAIGASNDTKSPLAVGRVGDYSGLGSDMFSSSTSMFSTTGDYSALGSDMFSSSTSTF